MNIQISATELRAKLVRRRDGGGEKSVDPFNASNQAPILRLHGVSIISQIAMSSTFLRLQIATANLPSMSP